MSWGAENRSKDAKTPSAARAMSRNPKLALCGIQRYVENEEVRLYILHSAVAWQEATSKKQSARVVVNSVNCPPLTANQWT
jgi:hypothetical protein